MMLSSKLRKWATEDGSQEGLIYWCQGCDGPHQIRTKGAGDSWGWNGDVERPVFTPSVRVSAPARRDPETGESTPERTLCHTFVGCNGAQPGEVIFLSDCSHALAGQVLPLPDLPDYLRDDA